MGNRAAALRAAILAAHPGAEVEARGANWIRHLLPSGARALDVSSSLLHYDGDQEIDTTVDDSDDGGYDDRADHLPYRLYQRDGNRRIYPRRDVLTEYIELGRPEFRRPNGTYAVIPWDSKTRNDNVIAFHRSDARLEIVVQPARLKMNLVLLSQPTITRWRFPISIVGLTRQGANLIADSDGATVARLAPFTLEDANGVTREVPGTLNGHPAYQGAYIVEPDLSGLAYPVTIDPTVNVSVAANGDDGRWTASALDASATSMTFGNDGTGAVSNAFMRFDGITVPSGATIDVAYITLKAAFTNSQATCHAIVSAEDADDPAAVTTVIDANGRATTTATAAWNSIAAWTAGDTIQTPSLVSVVQEVVDRGGWASGNAMQFFIKDNSSSTNARRSPATLENTTHAEPALHIEYTEPVTTITAALLGPTSTLYPATLSVSAVTIPAALLGPTSTIYAATVAADGAVTISAAHLASGAVLYPATLTPGTATIPAALLGPTATLFAADVSASGVVSIAAEVIASTATLYPASFTLTNHIVALLLGPDTTLPLASIAATGSVEIAAELLASTATLYPATLTSLYTIEAVVIPSTSALYPATLSVGTVTISGLLLGPTATLYAATARTVFVWPTETHTPAEYVILLRNPRTLELLGEMPQYLAASWTRHVLEQGQFTARLHRQQIDPALIARNTIVEIRRNGAYEFAGIIRHAAYDAIEQTWDIIAPGLKWWLNRRSVFVGGADYDAVTSDPAETALKHYVADHLTAPADSTRDINNELAVTFTAAADQGRGTVVDWNARWGKLLTSVLIPLCESGDLWHDVTFAANYAGYVYDTYEYVDATETSGAVPIVFATGWDNVGSLIYSEEFLEIANAIYVLGAGEGAARDYREVVSADSIASDFRSEMAIDSRDNTSDALMDQDGVVMIACSLAGSIQVTAQPLTVGPTLYRRDWDLGYDVTLAIPEIGISLDRRIVEITVTLDPTAGETVQVALGAAPRTMARVIAEALRRNQRSQFV